MQTYVINLRSDVEKRESSLAKLGAVEIAPTLIDAVDGRNLSAADIAKVYDADVNRRLGKRPMTAAEIGCYLSHRKAWTAFLASGDDLALVLEDDFEFVADIRAFLDYAAWRVDSGAMVKVDAPRLRGHVYNTTDCGPFRLIRTDILEPRTTGYIVGRKAAKLLLDRTRRFFRPIDNDLKHLWEHGVPIFTAWPQLAREHPAAAHQSGIEAGRRKARRDIGPIGRAIGNVAYQARFRAALWKYRSKLRPAANASSQGADGV